MGGGAEWGRGGEGGAGRGEEGRCGEVGEGPRGSTEITVLDKLGESEKVSYPAEIGGTCEAWDQGTHPMCRGKDAPKWCKQRWCYVDPCTCDLPQKPKATRDRLASWAKDRPDVGAG